MITPTPTEEMMDKAIEEYRRLTEEQFCQRMTDDPSFRATIEAAYARSRRDPSKKFTNVDAAGWRLTQFCVDVPPAEPREDDGINAKLARKRGPKPIPGAAFPS